MNLLVSFQQCYAVYGEKFELGSLIQVIEPCYSMCSSEGFFFNSAFKLAHHSNEEGTKPGKCTMKEKERKNTIQFTAYRIAANPGTGRSSERDSIDAMQE
jgi:hypothetical protein